MIERKTLHGSPLLGITMADGSYVELYGRGATVTRWRLSDGTDIVAGYEDYRLYGKGGMYLGTTVGMTAGRIKDARCVVAGVEYALKSPKKHYLHGGGKGLDNVVFAVEEAFEEQGVAHVVFRTSHRHPIIPATADVRISYDVAPCDIRLAFAVTTDAPVLCNLTNHSYFNLSGDYDHPVEDHELRISADRIVLVDDEVIATDILAVASTPFDFRVQKPLLPVVLEPVLQSQGARGIDHYFLFDATPGPQLTLVSKRGNRRLDVTTTYPGTTVYTTNYPTKDPVQTGRPFVRHAAVAIEPQYQSNGCNDPRFHDFTLLPGEEYHHEIHYELKEGSR